MEYRRVARRAWGTGMALLLALSCRAQAEDAAALLARAPPVALDGAVTPLTAPVEVATVGWGPFHRLCVAQVLLRPDDGAEVATSPPSCFSITQARVEAGVWHITLRAEMGGRGPDITMTVTRDAMGRFGPVTIVPPPGMPPIAPEQFARLHAVMQAALRAHGLERTTVTPGASFVIPLPLGAVDPDMRVEGGGFACDPDGEARLRGRRIILAACATRAEGEIAPNRVMRIAIAGRFVIDVETGMVLRHGYASFLVLDADPRGSMPRTDMRGASRQSFE